MTITELATIIFLVCGKGESHYTLDCRDLIVNCAVGKNGEIEKSQVDLCVSRVK